MNHHATLPETEAHTDPLPSAPPLGLALVVIASASEPDREGEVLLASGSWGVFGRGSPGSDDQHPRLMLQRQRPAAQPSISELQNQRISRAQLLLQQPSPQTLLVRNIGRCRALLNGADLPDEASLSPGDVLGLGQQLTLLCTWRGPWLPPHIGLPAHPFGMPDAWGMVGESPAMWRLRHIIHSLALRQGHVLVLGPSGSGKELVAKAIHASSARRERPLVARNAATIPETLIDAELFGNAKNYPNPGMPSRPGLIGEAHGTTLFLDEFAELPLNAQTHLLRVLDSGDYQRLGEATARTSDFRLIAATNRPLSALKEDVLARFLMRVEVPGLEQRREDIPLLVRHAVRTIAAQDPSAVRRFLLPGTDIARIDPLFLRELVRYPYTTHTRELLSQLWASILQSPGDTLQLPQLPAASTNRPPPSQPPEAEVAADGTLSANRVQQCLDENNGSLEKSWRALGLPNRFVLRRLIQKWDLQVRKRIAPKDSRSEP